MKRKLKYLFLAVLLFGACSTNEPPSQSGEDMVGRTVNKPSKSPLTPNPLDLARSALVRGEFETALKHLNAVKTDAPYSNAFNGSALTYRGQTLYLLGILSQARDDLTEALGRNDKDFMARLYLGLVLLREQRTPEFPPSALTIDQLL